MSMLEEQHRAHLERQRRLDPAPPRPAPTLNETAVLSQRITELSQTNAELSRKVIELDNALVAARLDAKRQASFYAVLRPGALPRTQMPRTETPPPPEEPPHKWRPRIQQVIDVTAAHFGLTPDEFSGQARDKEIVRPRQIAMYLAKYMTLRSSSAIGTCFKRDHSTIISTARKIGHQYQSSPELAQEVEAIRAKINLLGGA